MSIESVTVQEARELVQEYHKDWIEICKKIKFAARRGEGEIRVSHIDNSEIRSKLNNAGFDVSLIDNGRISRIWWGS